MSVSVVAGPRNQIKKPSSQEDGFLPLALGARQAGTMKVSKNGASCL